MNGGRSIKDQPNALSALTRDRRKQMKEFAPRAQSEGRQEVDQSTVPFEEYRSGEGRLARCDGG
jgi:hypothetical protein